MVEPLDIDSSKSYLTLNGVKNRDGAAFSVSGGDMSDRLHGRAGDET
ncbi:hypothetical protein [Actinacidiphila reveromycinica]|nr:hypothetical protein [Streptomyces sp. SN-593]